MRKNVSEKQADASGDQQQACGGGPGAQFLGSQNMEHKAGAEGGENVSAI
jgi:hypothetical protein